jgi:hypothetical protein
MYSSGVVRDRGQAATGREFHHHPESPLYPPACGGKPKAWGRRDSGACPDPDPGSHPLFGYYGEWSPEWNTWRGDLGGGNQTRIFSLTKKHRLVQLQLWWSPDWPKGILLDKRALLI